MSILKDAWKKPLRLGSTKRIGQSSPNNRATIGVARPAACSSRITGTPGVRGQTSTSGASESRR